MSHEVGPPCERCGAPSICHISDNIEIEPEVGECQVCKGAGRIKGMKCQNCDGIGRVWYSRKTEGPPHHFCDTHARSPRVKRWVPPKGWTGEIP